jgi:hypothetical protein
MKSIVFKQITQVISREDFQKIVAKFSGDKHTKSFSSWNHLMVMLYAQLAGRTSLRDIVHSLQSNMNCLYHMGIGKVSRNNLSYRNENRDSQIFQSTYFMLRNQFIDTFKPNQCHKFRFKDKLLSIDSSTISLCKSLFGWATFRKSKAGIKMHTVLDHRSKTPEFIVITNAKMNDAKALNLIPLKKNCIYVQDRAYLCLKWLFSVVSAGSHFVIRLKKNTKFKMVQRNSVSKNLRKKGIRFDHIIKFTGSKKSDYPATLRHIKYRDPETGIIYNYITDNLILSAFTIAEIYRDRWQIELFFKKIKQNLKIKHFLGLSENAIRIQIWVAMIVVLLYEWNKYLSASTMGLQEFMSRIQLNLFSRKLLENILNKLNVTTLKPPSQNPSPQLDMFNSLLGQ